MKKAGSDIVLSYQERGIQLNSYHWNNPACNIVINPLSVRNLALTICDEIRCKHDPTIDKKKFLALAVQKSGKNRHPENTNQTRTPR